MLFDRLNMTIAVDWDFKQQAKLNQSLKIVCILANSADPVEMPQDVAFQLGLHCLPKKPSAGIFLDLFWGRISTLSKSKNKQKLHKVVINVTNSFCSFGENFMKMSKNRCIHTLMHIVGRESKHFKYSSDFTKRLFVIAGIPNAWHTFCQILVALDQSEPP